MSARAVTGSAIGAEPTAKSSSGEVVVRHKQVIVLEFNELSPELLDEFMAAGDLPGFKKFYDESAVYVTDADASQPNLEPWIQWPTVHLGVSHREHGIRHLGDEDPLHQPVGELLSAAGRRVGICGSMNVPHRSIDGFSIPDPWNEKGETLPPELAPFHRTVSRMVQESSRGEGSVASAELPAFARLMIRHGLRPVTVWKMLRQLAQERREPALRWRRASVLDLLQYDLFRNLVRGQNPEFATFFSNSTAHYQHYYWRHMKPEAFQSPPDEKDHASLREAVRFGYRSMDAMVQRFMSDFPEALLVLCTALSQEAWTDSTKMTYRPHDVMRLLDYAGLPKGSVSVQPIMAEEFVLRFESEADAARGLAQLTALRVGGVQLLDFVNEGTYLVGGCAINDSDASGRLIEKEGSTDSLEFGDLFYPIHSVRSGRHNPHGALWWRTMQHTVAPDTVPLTAIAPTILSLLDVPAPPHVAGVPLALE